VTTEADSYVISEQCERKNSLIRPPLANVDVIFTVVASAEPTPVLDTLDKLMVICEHNGIRVVPVFTKSDISSPDEYAQIYKKAGYDVFCLSSVTGEGVECLREYIEKTVTDGLCAAFAGASGVGKSTLLNSLFPTLQLATGDISKKISRGKHTTRHVEIFRINEKDGTCGYLADTPGFSSLSLPEKITKDSLKDYFIEFENYETNCRFSDCVHISPKFCGVCEALDKGLISLSRYNNYKTLYESIKDKKEWK
jgi:ribosome biogenesis GTPase